ncbi:MAG: glycosyltransferase family 2 protein [Methylacidiphilales bacterium]|nr:glycosyltransferase family 2 protein [Candidatus Methylacidiphilales bacterium]
MITDESNSFVFNLSQKPQLQAEFEQASAPGFLSVIIPVYKDVAGLTDTLISLQKQTLAAEKFEVLVVNDGGHPAISEVCAKFPVREIVQTPNQGSYAARNAGLRKSRGALIGLADADEVLDPEWCEKGIAALERADIVVGLTRFMLSSPPTIVELWQEAYYFPIKQMVDRRMAMTANLFLRREVFEKMGWFDARLRSGGDIDFTFRVGRDPAIRFIYDERVKCEHPARNYRQVVQSIERIAYGHLTASAEIKEGETSQIPVTSFFRLFFPPKRLSANDLSHMRLSLMEKIRLYLFSWFMKWKTAQVRLSVRLRCKRDSKQTKP